MDKQEYAKFSERFAGLSPRRRTVLLKLLAGETDAEIAQSLGIQPGTVRKVIADICQVFGLEKESAGERRSKRADLVALFAKYKPELLGEQAGAITEEAVVAEAAGDKTQLADRAAIQEVSGSESDAGRKENDSGTKPSPTPDKIESTWVLVLSGTVKDVDRAKAEAIVSHLQKLLEDADITIKKIEKGSVVIVLESSLEAFQRIKELYQWEAFTEICGIRVLDVYLLDESPVEVPVNLSRWLQNNFVEAVQADWQTIEEMLGQRQVAFRSAVVRRAKQIDLGGSHTFVMTVDVSSETDEEIGILLRLYPTDNQTYLPENLKLTVLDESGVTVMEVAARSNDDWIQYQLTGDPGERFSVLVALGELSLIENFVI